MPARKIVNQHRAGKGKTGVHRLTVLRSGPIGATGASRQMADTFVDIAPHMSLKGLEIDRMYDRRGNTMRDGDESHIQSRTKGKRTAKHHDNRSHAITARGEFGHGR